MKQIIHKRVVALTAFGIILCAVFVFVSTVAESLWYAPDSEIAVPDFGSTVELFSPEQRPSRLRVPALEIDAYVQHVGVNAKGNMATPNNFTDVGWYKYGATPGFLGSAVFAGHVDNGLGLSGVFKRLADIQIGDEVLVESKEGKELRFRVVEIQTYPHDSVPGEMLFARNDRPRLNLITCEGVWVPGERTYDQRLVVYTELVE